MELILNHSEICILVYCGNLSSAIKIFDDKLHNILKLNDMTSIKYFLNSLNFSIYNYVLFKEGISLDKCCFKNTIVTLDYFDFEYLSSKGHQLLFSYITCIDYLSEKHNHPEIKKSLYYINQNINEDISLDSICHLINMNKSYFCTIFKKHTGKTFSEYINHRRISIAKKLIQSSKLSLSEISFYCGFNNYSYFCKVFKRTTLATPIEFRKRK